MAGRFLEIAPFWVLLEVLAWTSIYVINLRLGQWQVRKKAIHYGALQVSMSLLNAVISLCLVVVLNYGSSGRVAGQSFAPFMMAIIALSLLYKDGLLLITWRHKLVKEVLSFGISLIPHAGGAFLLLSVDRLVINQELGL